MFNNASYLLLREKELLWPSISIFLPGIFIAIGLLLGQVEIVHAAEGFATYYTTASCQKEGTSGVFTASRERFDEKAFTCAMRSRAFGREILVYGQATGKIVVVRHNDFGPNKSCANRGTIIDLSPAAFKEVCGELSIGKCLVSIQEVL